MAVDSEELARQLEALKQALADRDALLAAKDEQIQKLEQHVEVLRRLVFGPRSEKRRSEPSCPGESRQGHLFYAELIEQAERVADEKGVCGTIEERRAASPRRRGRRKKFPEHLPRIRTTYELPAEQRRCSCGGDLHEIGEELSRELERVEVTLVHEIARKKYACRRCAEGVRVAPGPDRVIDKGLLGVGFLAHVIQERFGNHLPYHRLERKYASEGVALSRTVLYQSLHRCADLLEPIAEQLRREVLDAEVIHTDDTPVVIAQAGAEGRKLGRVWVYLDREGRHYFDFTTSRSRDGPLAVLGDYRGFIQADAYSGYDRLYLPGGATQVGCWAHVRRKCCDARSSEPDLADEAVRRIGELYAIEKQARERQLPVEEVAALRRAQSRPRLESLRAWLELTQTRVLPRGPLAQAIHYALSQWPALSRYVEDGRLAIDNNPAENALRPIAVGRKNWLFVGNEGGGRRAAILFSLLRTAQALGLHPREYFRDVLLRIAKCSDVTKLTPHGWKEHFEPEIRQRREKLVRSYTAGAS